MAVRAYLLSEYDYDAEPSFITQIKEHVVAQYVSRREQDMNKLVPLLDVLTYENTSFSATLTVQHKEQGGSKVVVLEYCGVDSVQCNRDVLKGLKDVKLLSLICIWPWAAASLPLGAPVRSVDAAHVSVTSGYGRMMNVAMRVGKTYVPLATSFCAREAAPKVHSGAARRARQACQGRGRAWLSHLLRPRPGGDRCGEGVYCRQRPRRRA